MQCNPEGLWSIRHVASSHEVMYLVCLITHGLSQTSVSLCSDIHDSGRCAAGALLTDRTFCTVGFYTV